MKAMWTRKVAWKTVVLSMIGWLEEKATMAIWRRVMLSITGWFECTMITNGIDVDLVDNDQKGQR